MSVRDLMPWSRGNNQAPDPYRNEGLDPFLALHRNVNRLFDEVFHGFDAPSLLGRLPGRNDVWPSIEVNETDKDLRIVAEVPGLEEQDIDVLLENGVLCIRGERKSEDHDARRHFSERHYGLFERRITVGHEIEEDKIEASYANGVLTILVPKSAKARASAKRIAINNKH
ncbi:MULTISPECIES: Hsp20/alpha crystallin family protein [Phyllobacterium]|uniref:Hsp20/alpha crystallin family protein n=1 Tax=Phyllobacterium TaxID=28100 RepID=UPI001CBF3AFD|nr:Hsp20/alpha crystallin family protein [Phyllobacterium calauticae]MBZ3695400.1 Hsp20/alpha crystallin family protein [Phyllobacterium calauticae]